MRYFEFDARGQECWVRIEDGRREVGEREAGAHRENDCAGRYRRGAG